MLDRQKLDSQLMLDEGLKLKAYRDTKGILTIGVGRNLDANPLSPSEIAVVGHDGRTQPITLDQAVFLLHNDEMKALNALQVHCPWWPSLDDVRARVMVDLMFNMGWRRLQLFYHFLDAVSKHDFSRAADELQDSAWFSQVGLRGPRLVKMIKTGEDYTA